MRLWVWCWVRLLSRQGQASPASMPLCPIPRSIWWTLLWVSPSSGHVGFESPTYVHCTTLSELHSRSAGFSFHFWGATLASGPEKLLKKSLKETDRKRKHSRRLSVSYLGVGAIDPGASAGPGLECFAADLHPTDPGKASAHLMDTF